MEFVSFGVTHRSIILDSAFYLLDAVDFVDITNFTKRE